MARCDKTGDDEYTIVVSENEHRRLHAGLEFSMKDIIANKDAAIDVFGLSAYNRMKNNISVLKEILEDAYLRGYDNDK